MREDTEEFISDTEEEDKKHYTLAEAVELYKTKIRQGNQEE
jgi:hypothetical protein